MWGSAVIHLITQLGYYNRPQSVHPFNQEVVAPSENGADDISASIGFFIGDSICSDHESDNMDDESIDVAIEDGDNIIMDDNRRVLESHGDSSQQVSEQWDGLDSNAEEGDTRVVLSEQDVEPGHQHSFQEYDLTGDDESFFRWIAMNEGDWDGFQREGCRLLRSSSYLTDGIPAPALGFVDVDSSIISPSHHSSIYVSGYSLHVAAQSSLSRYSPTI